MNNHTNLIKDNAGLKGLLEEKANVELRLQQLGYDGDCAYEKAMVAFYTSRLQQCTELIEEMN